MSPRGPDVLVAYGSRAGSTREIAERIATRLRRHAETVEVLSVDQVIDVDRYRAVVLGSGVYNGSWTADTVELVRRSAATLATRPVWFFSVGTFGDRHPVIGRMMVREPREINEFTAAIHPRDYRVFAGVIDGAHWPWYGKLVLRAFGGRFGDNRDWRDIETWADGIGRVLASHAERSQPARVNHPSSHVA